ncbi:CRISPR-associated helicase Cas3' [Amycolatopsis sp. EV170708-02-1]|uniref:CRISPR-associated helicase Cas3' n=1 Tax=Amycolatopsis sp. EV170708-02-1 TaxID=2919322 RepID=UPI001F0BDA7E|nr:CRISPR-associated helicase Cas3' [Amycolatopsis sp. EV170708-02-1]UMP07060.1 CRISPR-associated helicase Cas3' [Amycolatopsis sp. EV170708-02-1]
MALPGTVVPWGKSSELGGCHPLICHSLDTAAVAQRLVDVMLGGVVRAHLAEIFPDPALSRSWVPLLCGLHDIGKYAPDFQALVYELAVKRFEGLAIEDLDMVRKPAGMGRRVDAPHGILTALHVRGMLESWGAAKGPALRVSEVLGGHHGHFPAGEAVRQARGERNAHGGEKWAAWRTALVLDVIRLRGVPEPGLVEWRDLRMSLPAAVGLAALTAVSDWVASDSSNFPALEPGADLSVYAETCDTKADEAVARSGMSPWSPPAQADFETLFRRAPRPVQQVVERVTSELAEPVLLVVEAPTGEGKSKAALQAATSMVRQLGVSGFYVAMPTQATSNQMLLEIQSMLHELGDETPVNLVHAGVKPADVGRDAGDDDVAARSWFTRKRSLLARLGCGTTDQVLKGAIRSGHVFVRLAALSNKVVVFDEVHAYDVYMSTLLERLLMWLGALGTPVILLSATLPAGRRHALIAAWQAGRRGWPPQQIPAALSTVSYPRVTVATETGVTEHSAGVSKLNKDRRIHLSRVDDDKIVNWLLDEASQDRCVAVVHNLVRRAIKTYDSLKKRIDELPEVERQLLIAINGTLPAGQRRDVEQQLRDLFGEDGVRPQRAIVIGTQVLEQSLDLDFDTMLTDLAPIDALIQRAGRIHRHRRDQSRGPLRLVITGVTDRQEGPQFPPYLRNVYAPIALMRTWALLRDRPHIDSPAEVSHLVDQVYGGEVECPQGWTDAWRKEEEHLRALRKRDSAAARTLYLPMPHAVEDLAELTERPKSTKQTRKQSGSRR